MALTPGLWAGSDSPIHGKRGVWDDCEGTRTTKQARQDWPSSSIAHQPVLYVFLASRSLLLYVQVFFGHMSVSFDKSETCRYYVHLESTAYWLSSGGLQQ